MKVVYIKEILHSDKKNKDYYVIRYALYENDVLIAKSEPIFWLTKEQFENFKI